MNWVWESVVWKWLLLLQFWFRLCPPGCRVSMVNRMLCPYRRRWMRLLTACLGLPFCDFQRQNMVDSCSFGSASSSVESVLFTSKKFRSIRFTFFSLLSIEHLLEQVDDILRGMLGLLRVLKMVLLCTLTFFQGSVLAAKFCCREQEESLILLVKGVSTFHCGFRPGQMQRFLVAWIAWVNSSFEKVLLWFPLLVWFTHFLMHFYLSDSTCKHNKTFIEVYYTSTWSSIKIKKYKASLKLSFFQSIFFLLLVFH